MVDFIYIEHSPTKAVNKSDKSLEINLAGDFNSMAVAICEVFFLHFII